MTTKKFNPAKEKRSAVYRMKYEPPGLLPAHLVDDLAEKLSLQLLRDLHGAVLHVKYKAAKALLDAETARRDGALLGKLSFLHNTLLQQPGQSSLAKTVQDCIDLIENKSPATTEEGDGQA
jgi:hypothetical protein